MYKNYLIISTMAIVLVGCSNAQYGSADLFFSDEEKQNVIAQVKEGGLLENDTKIITNTVTNAEITELAKDIKPLAWNNPVTGSSGTVVAINEFMTQNGQSCRSFKTSVATFVGSAFYDGDVCQNRLGEWILALFTRSDENN